MGVDGKKCFWIRIVGFGDTMWGEEGNGRILCGCLGVQGEEDGSVIQEASTMWEVGCGRELRLGQVNLRGLWALVLAPESSSCGRHLKLVLILIAERTGLQTSHMLIKKLIKTHQF